MELLSNAFSVLDLDADDDRLNTSVASSATSSNSNNKGKTDNGVKTEGKLKSQDSSSAVASSSAVYKMPLVWIDLEMTGLNVEVDRILEIACIITDGNLTKSVEGPDLVIHQSKECLEKMGEWCQTHHTASGLINKVLQSKVSETEAEKQKYMPDLANLFSHVVVDVSSVNALCMRWFPRDKKKAPLKENKHRAMDDIRESIKELKYYKANLFKTKSKS